MEQALDTLHSVTTHLNSRPPGPEGTTVFSTQVVAKAFAQEARLLCLDDVQVTDATTMALLTQILGYMHQYGVVLCCTSNRAPADLYQGAVNTVWAPAMAGTFSAL